MKNRIAFALLMGAITTGAISFALVYLHVGSGGQLLAAWLTSWGLAYLIVIPIMLLIAPKIQRLTATLFIPKPDHDTGSIVMGAMRQRLVFALLMGVITTGVISFAVLFRNLGLREDFVRLWLRAWALGYGVVVPMILALAPPVQRLVDRAFGHPSRRSPT
ncbi:MAG: DUF2798 domain-containing protein [Burkholderiaceae bacterium]|nr:DUF2798 domain-containing protein [Burkholderiaceae bacterium]